jgi:hypothetical protein
MKALKPLILLFCIGLGVFAQPRLDLTIDNSQVRICAQQWGPQSPAEGTSGALGLESFKREQPEQPEQFEQSEQFFRLSSAACAASADPQRSTEHLFRYLSLIQVAT